MTPEELEANLKDSLEHYLECATEPDFLEVGPGSFTCPNLTGLITLQVVSKAALGWCQKPVLWKDQQQRLLKCMLLWRR